MNEEEKEAIDRLEFFKKTGYATFMIKYGVDRITANGMITRAIEVALNLIQKQEKIIDKMAEQLAGLAIWNDNIEEALILGDKQAVKEYFKKVVEEDE
jgi:hypothetical protein